MILTRTEPDNIYAERLEIVELAYDTGNISYAIAVCVTKGCGINLVN